MTVDTRSMRELLDAAPGNHVAMEKDHVRKLLDVVDAGQTAAFALVDLTRLVPPGIAA